MSNGTYQVSATVGEAVVETFTTGTIILTQGFQQSNSNSTSVEELEVIANYKLFPNPTLGNATLELETTNTDADVSIVLYNAVGKLIYSKTIFLLKNVKATINLDLTNHSSGVYYVNVLDSKHQLAKGFQLVKK